MPEIITTFLFLLLGYFLYLSHRLKRASGVEVRCPLLNLSFERSVVEQIRFALGTVALLLSLAVGIGMFE